MIIVKLQGGLGNQMFEYAFGRSIQTQVNQKMLLDISDFEFDTQRDYSLCHFRLNDDIIVDSSGKYNLKYDQRKNKLFHIGRKCFPDLQYNFFAQKGIYIWDCAKYKEVVVKPNQKDMLFHGYWQGYQYSEDIVDILRNEFTIKDAILPENIELHNYIINTNSVCVHIRRGDFLSRSNTMYNCQNDYYRKGLIEIEKRDTCLTYFIFSDDIEEVKNKISFDKREVVFVNNKNPDYEEFRLMQGCKHFVISNSTFSWWAANLSQRKGKKVVVPQKWYTDGQDASQFIKKNWIAIDN